MIPVTGRTRPRSSWNGSGDGTCLLLVGCLQGPPAPDVAPLSAVMKTLDGVGVPTIFLTGMGKVEILASLFVLAYHPQRKSCHTSLGTGGARVREWNLGGTRIAVKLTWPGMDHYFRCSSHWVVVSDKA